MSSTEIAVFHNFMDNIGGAERVALTLARSFRAPLYSTNVSLLNIAKQGYDDVEVRSIGKVPLQPPLRQQISLARFRHLNLGRKASVYVIAGDWAVSAAVNHHPNVWYCHSPCREIWDFSDFVAREVVPKPFSPIYRSWAAFNRRLYRRYVSHVDKIICNSEGTRQRVKEYFNREATVVSPPVEVQRFHHAPARDYWLSVNRLIHNKQLEIQLETFAQMPNRKLIIVGSYEKAHHFTSYARKIFNSKPANVEILSGVDQATLVKLYSECRGVISTSMDEDFGMTAIEAMASGKPMVAPRRGGYVQSVIDGLTGKLYLPLQSQALRNAIEEVEERGPETYQMECEKRAQSFDVKSFNERVSRVIF